MTYTEVMQLLKKKGTAQNQKIYRKHGMTGEIYGVSFAELGALHKKIKVDHALALEIWKSGVADAQNLALMIADPAAVTEAEVDAMAKDVDNYCLADALARFVGKTRFARKKETAWVKSKDEWLGRAGWALVGQSALDANDLDDAVFAKHLVTIEAGIHKAKNFTKHGMHMALIAIGGRNESLKRAAVAAAGRIGKVEVDHGDTACKTPDAIPYIEKIWAHKTRKSPGRK